MIRIKQDSISAGASSALEQCKSKLSIARVFNFVDPVMMTHWEEMAVDVAINKAKRHRFNGIAPSSYGNV